MKPGRQPDDALSHELGHIKAIMGNPVLMKTQPSLNCQDPNNYNNVLVKPAVDAQMIYVIRKRLSLFSGH